MKKTEDTIARPSVASDIKTIADNVRDDDRRECMAAARVTPEKAMSVGLLNSPVCMTILNKDVPIAMIGVMGRMNAPANIWLIGSNRINLCKKSFYRVVRGMVKIFLKYYPMLYNWVDERNLCSLRLIRGLNGTIHAPERWGLNGMMFRKFEIKGTRLCASR